MPSRHLGRCDGHHEMVDCIGPLSDPEGSGQRPLWPLVNLLRAIKPIGHKPTCVRGTPLANLRQIWAGRDKSAARRFQNGGPNMPMPLIPNVTDFQRKLATFPLATYQAGETVLSACSKTGRLLILKEGAVAVLKEGVEIARVTEPGAVFGELSVLLDQPHSAEVRALEASQFHVADGATTLRTDPVAVLYVATVLAQRLDSANRALLDLKRQVLAGEPRSVVGRTVEKIEGLLGASGGNLANTGYPYDPFAT